VKRINDEQILQNKIL